MKQMCWIYDEHDSCEPGWQLWRVCGRFEKAPGKHLDETQTYVLGQRAVAGGAFQSWMLRPALGSLHQLESRGGVWGKLHRRLLSEKPFSMPAGEWMAGIGSLSLEIDELLGRTDHVQETQSMRQRSLGAPKRWGQSVASKSWQSSMHIWSGQFEEWSADASSGALGMAQYAHLKKVNRLFLRKLAQGALSPGQALMESVSELDSIFLFEPQTLLLAAKMQAKEIEASVSKIGVGQFKVLRI